MALYASEHIETALAEKIFHSVLRFIVDAPSVSLPSTVAWEALQVICETARHIDLTAEPLARHRAKWTHRVDYTHCQALANAARQAGVEILRSESVRDPRRRANVTIFSCKALASGQPTIEQWKISLTNEGLTARSIHGEEFNFEVSDFASDPRIEAHLQETR